MSDIKGNIDPSRLRDQGWYSVQPTEAVRKEHQEIEEKEQKTSDDFQAAALLVLCKRIFLILLEGLTRKKIILAHTRADLMGAVQEMRLVLSKLAEEDLSYDPAFAHQLSEAWVRMGAATESYDWSSRKKESNELLQCIEAMSGYPKGSEHTVGSYLTKFAGRAEWLPFPFLELLHGLHEDAAQKKEESTLSSWINLLERGSKF